MMDFERLVLIGALAAAVTVGGALNARVKDLVQQRDIYQSRAANWEQDALNWQTEAQEAEAQVADLKNDLEAAQTGPAGFSAVYLGEFVLHRLLLGAVRTYLRHRGRHHRQRRTCTGRRDRGSRPGHFAPRLCDIH